MSNQNSNQNINDLNIDRVNANNTTVRILLDFYMNLHTQTIRRIDSLYDILDEIRSAINVLGGINSRLNETNRNNYRTNDDFRFGNRYQFNRERGNRGARGGRGANMGGRGNMWSGERTNPWYNNDNTQTYFDWLNNRIYIQGRPYRIEFERYTMPQTHRNGNTDNDMLNFIQNFYSNVPVIATPAQIQSATRLTRFSDVSNPLNSSCPITLEPFTNDANVSEILGCNHLFQPEALTSWFQSNVRCPVCRYDIRTNRIVSRQEEETKEEGELEETKEDPPISIPILHSSERPVERNSNSRRRVINRNSTRIDSSDNILESTLTEITGTLLNQLFNNVSQSGSANRLFFNNSFDASNNEIIFRGFRI